MLGRNIHDKAILLWLYIVWLCLKTYLLRQGVVKGFCTSIVQQ